MSPSPRVYVNDRHCMRCGRSEYETSFTQLGALRCDECIERIETERKIYTANYQKARVRALRELINLHSRQFQRILREELAKVEDEARQGELASGAP